jgi:hypothetical protein
MFARPPILVRAMGYLFSVLVLIAFADHVGTLPL